MRKRRTRPRSMPDRRRRALQISAAALVTLLAAAAAVWSLRPHAPKLQLVAAEITTPRTFDPWSFALAPDGRRIAFVADHEGYSMLWVRDLDSVERARVDRNGRRAAALLVARRPIDRLSSRTASSRESTPRAARRERLPTHSVARLPRGDRTEPFSSPVPTRPRCARSTAAGGSVTSATAPAADSTGHRHPQYLPGGRQFLFFVGGPNAVRGVYLGSLDSPDATRLLASDTPGSLRVSRLAAVRSRWSTPGAIVRSCAPDTQRRADHRCGFGGRRARSPAPARFRLQMREC